MSDLSSFTYNSSQGPYTLDLRRRPDHGSRETSGVWVFSGRAWMIFPSMKQWNRIGNDYAKATNHYLPTPPFEQIQGTVTDHHGRVKDGFPLVATYIRSPPACFFALKSGNGTLMGLIEPFADVTILWKCEVDRFTPQKTTIHDYVRDRRTTLQRQQWGQWR